MVGGDDVDLEELPEDDRWPDQQRQWTGTGRPHLVRRLSDLSVKVGTRARFLVEVSSPTPVSVRWEKDGRTLDENDRVRMVTEGHFHCVDISPVFLEDSGLWRVVVTNIVGTTISSAQLALLIPKAYKKPEFVEPLRAILTAQGTVSLECKVVGVPTPLLRWFKGGAEIKAGDVLALTPSQTDPTSLGTYTCLATNCMGSTESTSVVHVDSSTNLGQSFLPLGPKPNLLKDLRNEKSKLGGNVTFECKVSVPPWPESVAWYGPSGEIGESSRFLKLEDGAGGFKLRVSDITAEDNGSWKCVVSSKTGAKAITSANLSVNYPKNYRKPKFLENLKAILTEEGLVSFECKVVGYPTPHLSWFKDGLELKPGDVYQLTGTNSLGSYCCIAKNCMGEAESTAVLTLEDIKSQLSEEDRLQLSSEKLPPRFIQGLKSAEAKINENYKFTVQVSVFPEPTILWFKDDEIIETNEKYKLEREKLGVCHLTINKLEFSDQAEWKCVATNDYGQSVTSCFLKLNIPKHFKKPKFLEDLKAVLSEEGAVNLECKVIGVPQPKLKWFKDGRELKPGDIHKIISGQDGTCCLGTYTCLAQNCMGSVSSSASLLGFEDKGGKSSVLPDPRVERQNALMMDRSLSTIHEERTSQLHDTTDKSGTIDDRAEEVSFSFDGKEVSVSLYETPDLTEEEALQIVEMYAEQISEHVSEHNVAELPPMRFTKESSNSGKLLMEAVVIDVSEDYFNTAALIRRQILDDDLRTDVDMDELSFVDEQTIANLSPDEVMTREKLEADFASLTGPPTKPPRAKHKLEEPPAQKEPAPLPRKRTKKKSTDSEKEDDSLKEFERRKKTLMQRKRTESELEDDSLYEFESRKKEEVRKSSPETGVAQTTENESVFFTAAKSPDHASAASKKSEDEVTFDTAEDSAFDRSEISVLESLAQSLHEFHREIANVEMNSDHTTLAQPLHEVQKNLEAVEAQIEFQEAFETLKRPLAQFQQQVSSIEPQRLSELIQSVQGPLEILTHEVAQCLEREKSVERVRESLAKMIEREASVPGGDKQIRDSVSKELLELEEKANDELERFYDRLLTVGSELRHKANQETDEEIIDVLRSVSDLIKPLKKLTAVTSKVIGIVVEDSEGGVVPGKKTVESLTKPLDALHVTVTLLENISMLRSHRAIRGAGIPVLYKVTVPMDELHTTLKLVENLSAHSAVEFLTPPLDNLIRVVTDIDIATAGEGFLENLPHEGVLIVKSVDDSLDVIVNCLSSIEKGVLMDDTERGIAVKMPALIKPIEELQKSLKAVEREIFSPGMNDEAYSVAQDVSRPLQSLRSELSILQHEIEACSAFSPTPVQNVLADMIGPLEAIQSVITSFHEAVMCKSPDEPVHLRFVMYALKEMSEPFNDLCSKIIKTEETLLGRGDPYRGLRAVARSVSELRESSVALTRESSVAERMSEPLSAVQSQLEKLIESVEANALSEDLLGRLVAPVRELQSAMEDVEGVIDESSAPELHSAVKDLQNSILSVQESEDVNEIYRLAEPIQALRSQFNEMQRVVDKSVIQADRAVQELLDCTRRASATINCLKQNRKGSPMGEVLYALGETIEEIENVLEFNSSQRKDVRDLTVTIDNTLGTSLGRLTDICAKADVLCATVEQKRKKSFVHVQDLIHDLKSGLEHASSTLTEDALSSIRQLSESISGFHDRLMSIEDLALEGVSSLKQQVDALNHDLEILRSDVTDKSDRLVLETVITDIHSVQRVVDNLVQENASDSARLRFVMSKITSIMNDLEDINRSQSSLMKQACRSALTVLNIGEALIQGKIKPEIAQAEDSVIGELLQTVDELESSLLAEPEEHVADELGKLRATIQRLATGASGGLLDRAEEICQPLKSLREKIAEKDYLFANECLEGVNERLDAILMPKQATTSIIGELLENVNDLEMTFEKFKSKVDIPRDTLNKVDREIIALQDIVDELTSKASGEWLDKAYEICIPIKSIEAVLMRVSTATQSDVYIVSEQLGEINKRLIEAKTRCDEEKNKREKEFEKLFSSESLNLAVDIPIVKSIVKTIEFMQAHLMTIAIDAGKEDLKDFLNKFESHLIQYGEFLVVGSPIEVMECVNSMEGALKSFKEDRKEIQNLKETVSRLKATDHSMTAVLPVLQAVLTPLRELHEDLSRPSSPREVKRAELEYLDEFDKNCLAIEEALCATDSADRFERLRDPVERLNLTLERLGQDQRLKGSDEESIVALRSLIGPVSDIRDITRDVEQALSLKDNSRAQELLSSIVEPVLEIKTKTAALQETATVQGISLNQIEELKQAVALMTKVPNESPELKKPLMTLHARLLDLSSDQEMTEVVSEISGPVESLKQAVERLESRGDNSILLEMCHQMIDIIQRSEECSEISSLEHSKAHETIQTDLPTAIATSHALDSRSGLLKLVAEVSEEERTLVVPLRRLRERFENNEDVKGNLVELKKIALDLKEKGEGASFDKCQRIIQLSEDRIIAGIHGLMTVSEVEAILDLVECNSPEHTSFLDQLRSSLSSEPDKLIGEVNEKLRGQICDLAQNLSTEGSKFNLEVCKKLVAVVKTPVKVNYETIGDLKEATNHAMDQGLPTAIQQVAAELLEEIRSFGPQLAIDTVSDNLKTQSDALSRKIKSESVSHLPGVKLCQLVVKAIDQSVQNAVLASQPATVRELIPIVSLAAQNCPPGVVESIKAILGVLDDVPSDVTIESVIDPLENPLNALKKSLTREKLSNKACEKIVEVLEKPLALRAVLEKPTTVGEMQRVVQILVENETKPFISEALKALNATLERMDSSKPLETALSLEKLLESLAGQMQEVQKSQVEGQFVKHCAEIVQSIKRYALKPASSIQPTTSTVGEIQNVIACVLNQTESKSKIVDANLRAMQASLMEMSADEKLENAPEELVESAKNLEKQLSIDSGLTLEEVKMCRKIVEVIENSTKVVSREENSSCKATVGTTNEASKIVEEKANEEEIESENGREVEGTNEEERKEFGREIVQKLRVEDSTKDILICSVETPILKIATVGELQAAVGLMTSELKVEVVDALRPLQASLDQLNPDISLETASRHLREPLKALEMKAEALQEGTQARSLCFELVEAIKTPVLKAKVNELLQGNIATLGEIQEIARAITQMSVPVTAHDPVTAFKAQISSLDPETPLKDARIEVNVQNLTEQLDEIKCPAQVECCRQLVDVIMTSIAQKAVETVQGEPKKAEINDSTPAENLPENDILPSDVQVEQAPKETIREESSDSAIPFAAKDTSANPTKELAELLKVDFQEIEAKPKTAGQLKEIVNVILSSEIKAMINETPLTRLNATLEAFNPNASIEEVGVDELVQGVSQELQKLGSKESAQMCRLVETGSQALTASVELQRVARNLVQMETKASILDAPLVALQASVGELNSVSSMDKASFSRQADEDNSALTSVEVEGDKSAREKLSRQVLEVIEAPAHETSEISTAEDPKMAELMEIHQLKTVETQGGSEAKAIEKMNQKPTVAELTEIIRAAEEINEKEIDLNPLKKAAAQLSPESLLTEVNLTEQVDELRGQLEKLEINRVKGEKLELCRLIVDSLSNIPSTATITQLLEQKPTTVGELRRVVQKIADVQTLAIVELPFNALKATIDDIDPETPIEQASLVQPLNTLSRALDKVEAEGNKSEQVKLCRQMIETVNQQVAQKVVTRATSLADLKPMIAEITVPELKPIIDNLQAAMAKIDPQNSINDSAKELQETASKLFAEVRKLKTMRACNEQIEICGAIAEIILLPEAQKATILDVMEIKRLSTVDDIKSMVQGLIQDPQIVALRAKIGVLQEFDEQLDECLKTIASVKDDIEGKSTAEIAEIKKLDHALKLIETPLKQKAEAQLNAGLSTVGELERVVNVLLHAPDKPEILNQTLRHLNAQLEELSPEESLQVVQELPRTLDALKKSLDSLRLEGNKTSTLQICDKMVAVAQNAVLTEVHLPEKIHSAKELVKAIEGIERLPKKPEVIKQGVQMLKGELSQIQENDNVESDRVQEPLAKFGKMIEALEATGDESEALKKSKLLVKASKVTKTLDLAKAKAHLQSRVISTEQLVQVIQTLNDIPNKPRNVGECLESMNATLANLPKVDVISVKLALQDGAQQLRDALKQSETECQVEELCTSLVETIYPAIPRCASDLLLLVRALENHPKKSKLLEHSVGELKMTLEKIDGETSVETAFESAQKALQELKSVTCLLKKAGASSEALILSDQITERTFFGDLESVGVLARVVGVLEDPQQPHSLNQTVKSIQCRLSSLPQEEKLEEHFDQLKEDFIKLDNVVSRLGKVGSTTENLSVCQVILSQVRPLLLLEKGVRTIGELKTLVKSIDAQGVQQAIQGLDKLNPESTLVDNTESLKSTVQLLEGTTEQSKKLQQVVRILKNPTSQTPLILQTVQSMTERKRASAGQLTQIVADIGEIQGKANEKTEKLLEKLKEFNREEELDISSGNLKSLDETLELLDVSVTRESLMKRIAGLDKSCTIGEFIKLIDTCMTVNPEEQGLSELFNQISGFPCDALISNVNLSKALINLDKSRKMSSKSGEKILETIKSAHADYTDGILGKMKTVNDVVEVIDCLRLMDVSRILETSLDKLKSRLMTLSPESSIQNSAEVALVDVKALRQSMGRTSGQTENLTKGLIVAMENAAVVGASQKLESVSSVHDLLHVARVALLLADDECAAHCKTFVEQLQSLESTLRLNECALLLDAKGFEFVEGRLQDSMSRLNDVVRKAQEQQLEEFVRLTKDTKDVGTMKTVIEKLSQCVANPLKPVFNRLMISLAQADNSASIDSIGDKIATEFELLKNTVDKFEINAKLNEIVHILIEVIDTPLKLKKAENLSLESSVCEVVTFVETLLPLDPSLSQSLGKLRDRLVACDSTISLELAAEQLQSAVQFVENDLKNESPVVQPCRRLIQLIREPAERDLILKDLLKGRTVGDFISAFEKVEKFGNTPRILDESVRSLRKSLGLQNPGEKLEAVAINQKESLINVVESFRTLRDDQFKTKNLYDEIVNEIQKSLTRAEMVKQANETLASPVSRENLKKAVACLNGIPDKQEAVSLRLKELTSQLEKSKYQVNREIKPLLEFLLEAAKQTAEMDSTVSELCDSLNDSICVLLADELTKSVVKTARDLRAVISHLITDPKVASTARQIEEKIKKLPENSVLDEIWCEIKPLAAQLKGLSDDESTGKLGRHLLHSAKHHETTRLMVSLNSDVTARDLENSVASLLDLQEPNRDKLISLQQILKQFDSNEAVEVLAEHLQRPLEALEKAASTSLTKLFVESVRPIVDLILEINPLMAIVEREKLPNVKETSDILWFVKHKLNTESVDEVLKVLKGAKTQNLEDSAELLVSPLSAVSQEINSKPSGLKPAVLCQKLVKKILPGIEKQIKLRQVDKLLGNEVTRVGQLTEIARVLQEIEPEFHELSVEMNKSDPTALIENVDLSVSLKLVEDFGKTESYLAPALRALGNVLEMSIKERAKFEKLGKLVENWIPGVEHMMEVIDGLLDVRKPPGLEPQLKQMQAALSRTSEIGSGLKENLDELKKSVEALEVEGNKTNLTKICRRMMSEVEKELRGNAEIEEMEKLVEKEPKAVRDLTDIIDRLSAVPSLEECFIPVMEKLKRFKSEDDVKVIFGSGLDVSGLSESLATCKSPRALKISLRLIEHLRKLCDEASARTKLDDLLKKEIRTISDLKEALEAIEVKSPEIDSIIDQLSDLDKQASLDAIERLPSLKLAGRDELSLKVMEAVKSAERRMKSLLAANDLSRNLRKLEDIREVILNLEKSRLWNETASRHFRALDSLGPDNKEMKSLLESLRTECQTNQEPTIREVCQRLIDFIASLENTKEKISDVEDRLKRLRTVEDLKECISSIRTMENEQKTVEQCLIVIQDKLDNMPEARELNDVAEELVKPFEALTHNLKFIESSSSFIALTQKLVKSIETVVIRRGKISKINGMMESLRSLGDLQQVMNALEKLVPEVAANHAEKLLKEIETLDLKLPVDRTPENLISLVESFQNSVKTADIESDLLGVCKRLEAIFMKPKARKRGLRDATECLKSDLVKVEQLVRCVEAFMVAAEGESIISPLSSLRDYLGTLKGEELIPSNLIPYLEPLEGFGDSVIAEPCRRMIALVKVPYFQEQAESIIERGFDRIGELIPLLQILSKLPSESCVLADSLTTLLKKSERLSPSDSIDCIHEPVKILDKLVISLEKEGHSKVLLPLIRKTLDKIQGPIVEKNILTQVQERFEKGSVKKIKDLQEIVQALSQIPNKPTEIVHGLLNVQRHLEQCEPDSPLETTYQLLEPALTKFEKSLSGLESTQMTSVCRQIVNKVKESAWMNEAEALLTSGITKAGQLKQILDLINQNSNARDQSLSVLSDKLSQTPPNTELEAVAESLMPTVGQFEKSLKGNTDEVKICRGVVDIIRASADLQLSLVKAEVLLNKHPTTAGEFKNIIDILCRYPKYRGNVKEALTQIEMTLKDDVLLSNLINLVERLAKVLENANEGSKAINLLHRLVQSFHNCIAQENLVKQAEEALKTGRKGNQLKTVARVLNQIEGKPKVIQDYLLEINEQLDSSSDASLDARFNQLQPILKNLGSSTSALKKEGCKWLGLKACESFVKAATKIRPEKQTIERISGEIHRAFKSGVSSFTLSPFKAKMIDLDDVLRAIKDMKSAKNALDLIIEMPQSIKTLDDALTSLRDLIDRGMDSAQGEEFAMRLKTVENCLSSMDVKFKRSGVAKLCQGVVNVVKEYVERLELERKKLEKKKEKEDKKENEGEKGRGKDDNKIVPKTETDGNKKDNLQEKIFDDKLIILEEEVKRDTNIEETGVNERKVVDFNETRKPAKKEDAGEPPVEYTSTVTTKTKPRDTSVHSTRGITVVELLDYQPPDEDERPQRRYRRSRPAVDARTKQQQLLRDYKSQDYLPITTPVRDYARKYALSAECIPSQDVGQAYKWDRSKEKNWKHLEFSTADIDFESPWKYHRSRRASSPYKDVSGSLAIDATRYQPAPIRSSSRARRSISPFEKAFTTTSISSLNLSGSRHLDQLISARIRPHTPTRSMTPVRSRSICRLDNFEKRAYICNGLCDKTVVHGGKIRLSCNITGDSDPSVDWLKDGKPISLHTESSRYKTSWNYGVASLEVDKAMLSDSGQYTCIVKNVDGQAATTCTVRVVLKDDDDDSKPWETIESELEANMPREICLSIKGADIGMPRVTGLVADPVVPSGGTIAVHVQVAGCHRPEVTWLHAGTPLPRYSPRVHYLVDGGLYTLLLEGATPAESGVYTCRVFGGRRGAVDTTTTIQVVERRGQEKPAQFTVRPDTRMSLSSGEDMTLACYVSGEPRPQVFLMRGIKDITNSCRTLKETFGEYVRLTLKRVTSDDRGTYFIMARNIYGTDRAFVTLEIRDRASSPTPSRWLERTSSLSSILKETSSQSSLSHWKSSTIHSSYSSHD